jgi:serine phosphatase RsbU (regulator of sigma subunit)
VNYASRIDEVIEGTKKHIKKITTEFTDEESQRAVGPLAQTLNLDAFVDRFQNDCSTYIKAAADANAGGSEAKIQQEEAKLEEILTAKNRKEKEMEQELKTAKDTEHLAKVEAKAARDAEEAAMRNEKLAKEEVKKLQAMLASINEEIIPSQYPHLRLFEMQPDG